MYFLSWPLKTCMLSFLDRTGPAPKETPKRGSSGILGRYKKHMNLVAHVSCVRKLALTMGKHVYFGWPGDSHGSTSTFSQKATISTIWFFLEMRNLALLGVKSKYVQVNAPQTGKKKPPYSGDIHMSNDAPEECMANCAASSSFPARASHPKTGKPVPPGTRPDPRLPLSAPRPWGSAAARRPRGRGLGRRRPPPREECPTREKNESERAGTKQLSFSPVQPLALELILCCFHSKL